MNQLSAKHLANNIGQYFFKSCAAIFVLQILLIFSTPLWSQHSRASLSFALVSTALLIFSFFLHRELRKERKATTALKLSQLVTVFNSLTLGLTLAVIHAFYPQSNDALISLVFVIGLATALCSIFNSERITPTIGTTFLILPTVLVNFSRGENDIATAIAIAYLFLLLLNEQFYQWHYSSELDKIKLDKAREIANLATAHKSNFLATMSHELRTPLNGILGMASLLRDTSLDKEQEDYLETLKNSGEHLLTIVNDILDFSKIEANKLQLEEVPFAPKEIANHLVKLLRTQLKPGVELKLELDSKIPSQVKSDPTRWRQVLLNLVGNAIKFTDKGEVRVTIAWDQESNTLIGTIRDTGIGISQDKSKSLFSDLYQTEAAHTRKFGGTGLGLVISHKLCQLVKGELKLVESTLGKGSTFRFEWPCKPVLNLRSQKAEPASNGSVQPPVNKTETQAKVKVNQSKNILVVEDNPTNQKFITILLRKMKVTYELAKTGQEALDAFEGGKEFALVLMDCQLPDINGLEVTKKIRKELNLSSQELTIVALTAENSNELMEQCLEAGMDGFLTKPLQAKQLKNMLESHNLIEA